MERGLAKSGSAVISLIPPVNPRDEMESTRGETPLREVLNHEEKDDTDIPVEEMESIGSSEGV